MNPGWLTRFIAVLIACAGLAWTAATCPYWLKNARVWKRWLAGVVCLLAIAPLAVWGPIVSHDVGPTDAIPTYNAIGQRMGYRPVGKSTYIFGNVIYRNDGVLAVDTTRYFELIFAPRPNDQISTVRHLKELLASRVAAGGGETDRIEAHSQHFSSTAQIRLSESQTRQFRAGKWALYWIFRDIVVAGSSTKTIDSCGVNYGDPDIVNDCPETGTP